MNSDEEISHAVRLFHEGEYALCAPAILKGAMNHILVAMEVYGLMLQYGLGVERNIEKSISMFESAANLGSGVAAHNLGTLYQTCSVDPASDSEKSKKWFQKAIDLGFIVSAERPKQ